MIEILKFLNNDSRFTLTGSRYWNSISSIIEIDENTDYDFVCEFNKSLVNQLLQYGFTGKDSTPFDRNIIDMNNYGCGNTVCVLYYKNINVIFKNDVNIYINIQNYITPIFFKNFLWKKYTPIKKIQDNLNFLYELEKNRIESANK